MTTNLMVDANGVVVSARQSVRPHRLGKQELHAQHQSRLEQAVKTDTVTAGVLTDMVVSINMFTFIFFISDSHLLPLLVSTVFDRSLM